MKFCAFFLLLSLNIVGILAGCTNKFGPWTRGAPIPQFHQEGQPTVVVGTKLYVVGAFGTNDLVPTDQISIYDFTTNNWTTSAVRTPFNSSHVNGAYDGRYIYILFTHNLPCGRFS
jgi:N-acetylneuraminic acid mutarotase